MKILVAYVAAVGWSTASRSIQARKKKRLDHMSADYKAFQYTKSEMTKTHTLEVFVLSVLMRTSVLDNGWAREINVPVTTGPHWC